MVAQGSPGRRRRNERLVSLQSVKARSARRWAPPPAPRPLGVFARTMLLPDGDSRATQWMPETEPAQALWLEIHDSGQFTTFVDVAPSQRGKTLRVILAPSIHGLVEKRESWAYVMPNLDKLAQNWEGKIRPAIEGTGFGAWLPTKGPGSKGGKPPALSLRDPSTGLVSGRLYFMALGSGTETSTSSVSVGGLCLDEADDADSAGQIQLVFKRIEAARNGRIYIASTVNERKRGDEHPILVFYGNGTQSRLSQRCPHCGQYQILEWDQVDLDRAAVACRHCNVIWSPGDRAAALNASRIVHHGQTVTTDGYVIGDTPQTETFSFLTTCLDYHMGSLPKMVAEYQAGIESAQRGDHSLAATFARKRLCADYTADQAQTVDLSPMMIVKLSQQSSYQIGDVPDPIEFITVGVDVQERWHYWKVLGGRTDGTFYHIAAGVENLQNLHGRALESNEPATIDARHACMERISREVMRWSGERKIVRRMIDVGHALDHLRPWLAKHPEWTPVVGRGEGQVWRQRLAGTGNRVEGGYLAGVADIRRQVDALGTWILWLLDVDNLRERVHDGYLLPREAPGAGHLPRGIELRSRDLNIKADSPTGWWARHLTAEIRKLDPISGKVEWVKRDGGGRHDLLDATVYAYAGALAHGTYLRQQAPTDKPPSAAPNAASIPRPYANELPVMPKANQAGRQFYQRKFSINRSRK